MLESKIYFSLYLRLKNNVEEVLDWKGQYEDSLKMNADLKLRVEHLGSEMKDMESLKNAELERCRNENDELQDLQRVAAENLATSQKVLTEHALKLWKFFQKF